MQTIGLKAALALAFWTGLGLLSAAQLHFAWHVGTWADAIRMAMPPWYVWGLLAPLLFAVDRRWLERLSLPERIAAHVPIGALFVVVALIASYAAQQLLHVKWLPASTAVYFLQQSFGAATTYALIACASVTTSYAARARRREQEAAQLALHSAQLETHLAEAKLRLLQAQLNPHFLFNAFNTISALTETDPKTARRIMERLATLLRSSLDHAGRQEVTLREELNFLEDYLTIERLRFEDRLTVDVRVEDSVYESRTGHVCVSARRAASRLLLEVEDDGVGLPEGWRLEDHAGIGLSNIARRLEELYRADHTFIVAARAEGGVRVEVSFPLRSNTA